MKVLISDRLASQAAERLRSAGHDVIERPGLTPGELVEAIQPCQALIVRSATRVTAELIGSAPQLRVIARAGTGLDNVDVAAARERGITVLNTPAANAVSVAELTIGLMLAFERHLVDAVTELRAGRWEKTRFAGRELAGRTLGLLGLGRIGREVATRARAFGMLTIAHDPALPHWPAAFEWVRRVSRDELLASADFVSLHMPLTAETRIALGTAELARMKSDAVLVNCARGGIVDETALVAALEQKAIRGAIVDVFATEPTTDHALLRLPNVIATPHLGASTREAQERAGIEAADLVIETLSTLAV